jgi:hypothetical protein
MNQRLHVSLFTLGIGIGIISGVLSGFFNPVQVGTQARVIASKKRDSKPTSNHTQSFAVKATF